MNEVQNKQNTSADTSLALTYPQASGAHRQKSWLLTFNAELSKLALLEIRLHLLGRLTFCLVLLSDYTIFKQH